MHENCILGCYRCQSGRNMSVLLVKYSVNAMDTSAYLNLRFKVLIAVSFYISGTHNYVAPANNWNDHVKADNV